MIVVYFDFPTPWFLGFFFSFQTPSLLLGLKKCETVRTWGNSKAHSNLLNLSCQPYPGVAFAYPQTAASASQLQPVGQMYPAPYQGMF